MERKLITLLTDFGYKDPFVGIIKGVIFGINPDARVIDLNHGIAPQDIFAGALTLRHSAPFFPAGTIHLAVVDPGVGTERRPLLIESEESFFIGPDNGILSLAVEGKQIKKAIALTNHLYHLKPASSTFHGRDIFSPVAAYLSLGIPAEDFGRQAGDFKRLSWPEVRKREHGIEGEIIYIDGFGNLITNIHRRDLEFFQKEALTISLGDLTVEGISQNYTHGAEKGYMAVINSWGLLEVSLFKGNASLSRGAKVGDTVRVQERGQARPNR